MFLLAYYALMGYKSLPKQDIIFLKRTMKKVTPIKNLKMNKKIKHGALLRNHAIIHYKKWVLVQIANEVNLIKF